MANAFWEASQVIADIFFNETPTHYVDFLTAFMFLGWGGGGATIKDNLQ